jgi:homoserine dehydrogenase
MPSMATHPALRVAVLGAGTVGGAVIRRILDRPARLRPANGSAIELAGVACRDLSRARDGGIPQELLTDAPAHLVASPDVDVVVELMGGDEPARTLIAAALSAGKPVVTANKHVIAHHGPELEAAARRHDVALRFEAAVAGGIPVLGPLAADLAANEITRIRGIVNGTTNYILTAMSGERRSYDEILLDAQERGYAEADPSGDVGGDDAVNKLVILARLGFGAWLDPSSIVRCPPTILATGRPGITGVTGQELTGAAALGLSMKLLATVALDGETVAGSVVPTAVPSDGPFGRTDGVTNQVEIDAVPLGTVRLAGPGAGGAATSSAVLGDLLAVARGSGSTWAGLPPADGPAAPAHDTLDGARSWYAFVPTTRSSDATRLPGARLADATWVVSDAGTAVRTGVVTLAEARAVLGRVLPDGVDATLYPVDD